MYCSNPIGSMEKAILICILVFFSKRRAGLTDHVRIHVSTTSFQYF